MKQKLIETEDEYYNRRFESSYNVLEFMFTSILCIFIGYLIAYLFNEIIKIF